MNLKRQIEVLYGRDDVKIKIILKYLCVLCMIFGFFVPQSFAFDVANCKQTKEKLDEQYVNDTRRVGEEFSAKLQEIIMNHKEKDLPLRCESCKDGFFCCEFSEKEREELEELESRRNLFTTFYEQELKDINWACKNHE